MGRGGGGGGGSRSSGGGHSSRSFGGTSSHSSRGGGSFSSSRGGSSYHYSGPRVSHHYHHYGGGYRYGYSRPAGPMGTLITAVVLLFIIGVFLYAATGGGSVAKSTVERERLKPYASFDKGAIDDDAGWVHDKKALLRGMESFYKDTGVQPAISIHTDIGGKRYLPDSEIEDFMTDTYDGLIGHERGILLLFCEYADSDWYAYYMAGEDAQTVMDSEACDILMDYVADLYTNSSYSDEEYFGAIFEKTGERIMTVTPTVASRIPMMVGGVVAIALVIGAVAALKAKHKRDAEKAAETERILNSPIDRI